MLTNDIATFLDGLAVAEEGTNMFRHDMPADPDTALCLYEYSAGDPDQYLDKPGLTVRTRALSADAARQLMQDVETAISFKGDLILSGTKYLIIAPLGSPAPNGRDERGRYEFVQNFSAIVAR